MPRLTRKHTLATRLAHWFNALALAVMIWSGLLISFANRPRHLALGPWVRLTVLPASFYNKLGLDARLAEGMAWHFAFMWLFGINGLIYVGYTFLSGAWRQLLPGRGTMAHAWQTLLHDLGLRPTPPIARKYNGLQQIAYSMVILMGLGSLLTGLAIYKPVQLAPFAALFGGYQAARAIHFWLTFLYAGFFIIHVVEVARAGWSNFRGMVIGLEPTCPGAEG